MQLNAFPAPARDGDCGVTPWARIGSRVCPTGQAGCCRTEGRFEQPRCNSLDNSNTDIIYRVIIIIIITYFIAVYLTTSVGVYMSWNVYVLIEMTCKVAFHVQLWSPFRNLPGEVEEIHKTCHGVTNRAPPDYKTGVTSWATLWDWRSAQRQWCCWRFAYSRMWRRVFGRVMFGVKHTCSDWLPAWPT
jgi:hypothetical protein